MKVSLIGLKKTTGKRGGCMCTNGDCLDCRLEKWKSGKVDHLYSSEEWDEWEEEKESELRALKNKYSFDKGIGS